MKLTKVMDNANAAALALSSESSDQVSPLMENLTLNQPLPNQQAHTTPHGPVAILWDIENCSVPVDVLPEDVAGNIRMALRVHPVINGVVTMFSAYGDFNSFPRRLREGCQRTGVKLIDVPNGRKDAADKAILVDMFLFALDNPPPSSIMLISGDVDFAPALHILGQRGYNVILVFPSGGNVSSALSNAGHFVWDWPSVARGEGFLPPARAFMPPRGGAIDVVGYFMGPHDGAYQDGHNGEESNVYRGMSQSSQPLSEYNSSFAAPYFPPTWRSHGLPSGLNEFSSRSVFSSGDPNELTSWVQPGDLIGLKGQLAKLLEMSGGFLPLARIHAEYQKIFGKPLFVSDYGANKLVRLLKKMDDTMSVEGEGNKKFVCLQNSRPGPSAPPLALAKRENRRGKGAQEENVDIIAGGGSSDELSGDERALVEEPGTDEGNLKLFKCELQEILVSYSCRIFLGCFEAIYQQRYKKPLDYHRFGVAELEELFLKVRDVVVLHEEPASKRKFLAAVSG